MALDLRQKQEDSSTVLNVANHQHAKYEKYSSFQSTQTMITTFKTVSTLVTTDDLLTTLRFINIEVYQLSKDNLQYIHTNNEGAVILVEKD